VRQPGSVCGVRGEGIFIQFNEKALRDWESRIEDSPRVEALRRRIVTGARKRSLDQVSAGRESVMCCYTRSATCHARTGARVRIWSASISERLYASIEPIAMAGILLYTAALTARERSAVL